MNSADLRGVEEGGGEGNERVDSWSSSEQLARHRRICASCPSVFVVVPWPFHLFVLFCLQAKGYPREGLLGCSATAAIFRCAFSQKTEWSTG